MFSPSTKSTKRCLVVLSGGQDSTTCLFWALERYEEVQAVTFNYGQIHAIEIAAAQKVATMAGVERHHVIHVPRILRSTSPLVDRAAQLERYTDAASMDAIIGDRVEKTFVPMRNTLFLTVAANIAVAEGLDDIITGVCQADGANYPDCTEAYICALQNAFNLSLGDACWHINIVTPLMHMSKADSIRMALDLPGCMDALAYSHTSYDGAYPPTDMNHANVLRAKGFEEAGVPDPLVLRAWKEGVMHLPATLNYDGVCDHETA